MGPKAAEEMLAGLSDAREVVLASTGHMFRFTHPDLYGRTITDFVDHEIVAKEADDASDIVFFDRKATA